MNFLYFELVKPTNNHAHLRLNGTITKYFIDQHPATRNRILTTIIYEVVHLTCLR